MKIKITMLFLIITLAGCAVPIKTDPTITDEVVAKHDLACRQVASPMNNYSGSIAGMIAVSWMPPLIPFGAILGWFVWEDVTDDASHEEMIANCDVYIDS
jgi:hypothetical protein